MTKKDSCHDRKGNCLFGLAFLRSCLFDHVPWIQLSTHSKQAA
jgi:hypothetical protein